MSRLSKGLRRVVVAAGSLAVGGVAIVSPWSPPAESSSERAAAASSAQEEVAPATPGDPTSEEAVELPPTTYEIYLARDPFAPVYTPSSAASNVSASDAPEPTGATQDDDADTGDDAAAADDTTGTAGGSNLSEDACSGETEVVCDGHVVTLVDVVGGAQAVVQVDTTAYEVAPGVTFATSFQALSIDDTCITLLYGDDAFTLCEGQQVLK